MVFAQVTDTEMQAAGALSGAAMAAFLAAPIFPQHARTVRIVVTSFYIVGVLAFIAYVLI